MPKVAEYVGPVEVRWATDPATGEKRGRGLFATRGIPAGEALLAGWPIARAENSSGLIQASREARRRSARARNSLACLADGSAGQQLPEPEVANEVLGPSPDVVPEAAAEDAEPNLCGIIGANCFSMQGWAGLYGLPSMLNHSCDGQGANALKLVLVFLDGAIIFRAARDIAEGEELCHRYFDSEGPLRSRREQSALWGFACGCRRCAFEDVRLPGTSAALAAEAAMAAWKDRLREQMHGFASAASAGAAAATSAGAGTPAAAGAGAGRRAFLQELLRLAGALVEAVESQEGWGAAELAWCLALVQPLSNASLWCLLQEQKAQDEARGVRAEEEDEQAQEDFDPLGLRCQVLSRIVASWEHTERYSFDHLRNLHMHWMALEEVKRRSAGIAGMEGGEAEAALVAAADRPEGRAAAEARQRCEKAFQTRFGIEPADLGLGTQQSWAMRLLGRLRS